MWTVTFPSPVVTPHPNNNTVHCEYFAPTSPGKHPGVIVLHILGGDFDLARLFCRALASDGTAALFLKMPYYGERRQPGSEARMISLDVDETVRGMTQAVLDIRRAAAWLAERDEVDEEQLGIMGISLGGITAALATSLEPRFSKSCLILAGGDIGEVAWTSQRARALAQSLDRQGGHARVVGRGLSRGRPGDVRQAVEPPQNPDAQRQPRRGGAAGLHPALWRAFGEPEIIWWDAGHYRAVRYIFQGLADTVKFFRAEMPLDRLQSTAK